MTMQAMVWWSVPFRQFAGKEMHFWKISGRERSLLYTAVTLSLVGLCPMRHSAWCLNRYHKQSATGHTPHEMVRGKSFTGMLAAFGECIMICKPTTNARRKGDSLWEVGVFLGKTENNLFLTGIHGEVRASRSAKRLADDYRGELVESVKTYPWQIKQSVLTTKVVPRRVLPGPAPVPALPGDSAPGGAIEDAGPGKDEAASDPSSSEEQGSQRNAAGIGSSSSNSTELRPSLEDVTVEVDDTAMPEAVNPGSSGRDERPILEQSPRTPKAPRKELHPPFFAGQVKAEEAFPHEDEILEWFEEEDDFSDMLTGIDEDEFYNEAAGPPDLSQEDLQIVERDSMQEEVHRLQEMKALEKVCFDTTGGNPGNVRDVSGTEADYKWLTTKFVFDWR